MAAIKEASKLEIVEAMLSGLLQLQNSIESQAEAIKKHRLLLLEPSLLFRHRKDFMAFRLAALALDSYAKNQDEDARRRFSDAANLDRGLGMEISRVLPLIERSNLLVWLNDLFAALSKGKEYFMSYVSTNSQELSARIRLMEDRKSAQRMLELLSALSGHEAAILLFYRQDCQSWQNYSINKDISFFIRRVDLFIKGGFENNMKFSGIYRDFSDAKLSSEILKSPEIKNLWRHYEQIKFIESLIDLCKKSEASGTWDGFFGKEGFWTNIDRHVKRLADLGNVDFSEQVKLAKEGIEENPEGWGGVWNGATLVKPGLLNVLVYRLKNDRAYQTNRIIGPASIKLIELLEKRELELVASRDKAIGEFFELAKKMSGVVNRNSAVKKMKRLLRKKKKVMLKNLGDELGQFLVLIEGFVDKFNYYRARFEEVSRKIDPAYIEGMIRKLGEHSVQSLNYTRQMVSRNAIARDLRSLVRTDAAQVMAQLNSDRQLSLRTFEHLSEDDLFNLREAASAANAVIEIGKKTTPGLSAGLEHNYLITEQEIKQIKTDWAQNRNFELAFVRRALDTII